MSFDTNITLLCVLVCAAALHVAWKEVPTSRVTWTFWVFITGALFGLVLGLFSMSCGIQQGNYCDKLEEHC